MIYAITGGSGFIGTHFLQYLFTQQSVEKIYVLDLVEPAIMNNKIEFIKCDIRLSIIGTIKNVDTIVHLAALCKEPCYEWEEYFKTNYVGTKNVIKFAEKNNINSIIFTSTMMVFKAGEKRNSEDDLKSPDTAYGISKLLAEESLLTWKACSSNRILKIVRPGVVFGKGENRNLTRLYKAVKNRCFFYAGRKDTIKGSVYVKDVIRFLEFCRSDSSSEVIYNLVFPQPDSIEDICNAICNVYGFKRIIPTIPYFILHKVSYFFEFLDWIGLKNPIHHRRIEKLYYSTHLSSQRAVNKGFNFNFNLMTALEDWKKDCDGNDLC